LKQLVSNLTQELLPVSKIEGNSIFKPEQLVVSNLVRQELLAVSKIETTSFETTVAQDLLAISNLAQELLAVSKIETTSFRRGVCQSLNKEGRDLILCTSPSHSSLLSICMHSLIDGSGINLIPKKRVQQV
jgi:hypothetical protein